MAQKNNGKNRLISLTHFETFLPILDIVVTILSFFLAYYMANLFSKDYFKFTVEYLYMLLLVIPTWALLLNLSNIGKIPRTRSTLSIFFNFLNFSFIGFVLLLLFKYLFNFENFSHYVIILFTILNLISLFVLRMLSFRVFKHFRTKGHNLHNVIIFADSNSEKFIDSIFLHKEWGFQVLMIITDSHKIHSKYQNQVRIVPDKINIHNIIKYDIIDEVIYCKSNVDYEKIKNLIKSCEEIGVIFRLQSELSPMSITNAHITHFENMPFLTFMNTPKNRFAVVFKSFIDFWISFAILFLVSPFMVLIVILIKFTSKGPVIFKQERVGLRGRKFYIYKFRTMIQDAEKMKEKLLPLNESDGPTFKIKNDPRVTLLGHFLRKSGLDELPQLFNVLKGEMSLIGPRPPLPEEVKKYERWQLRRLSVKPGITCTWQIIPNRNDILFESWMKLDIQYIDNWSIKSDFLLFFRTIQSVFRAGGH